MFFGVYMLPNAYESMFTVFLRILSLLEVQGTPINIIGIFVCLLFMYRGRVVTAKFYKIYFILFVPGAFL